MNPGLFDRKIEIQKISTEGNVLGAGSSETWINHLFFWAMVKPDSRSKNFDSEAKHSYKRNRFTTFFNPTVDDKMRISYDGLIWRIISIVEIGYKEKMEILAEAVL